MIRPSFVVKYFKKWANNSSSPESKNLFICMLQGKVIAAKTTGQSFFCFDKNYNAAEIEEMLVLADDFFSVNNL